jgi:hypothetical protein
MRVALQAERSFLKVDHGPAESPVTFIAKGLIVMRQYIVAAAITVGLIALWAAALPLAAEPAARQAGATSPAISKAMFLCRGPSGVDQACVRALAKALVLGASADTPAEVGGRHCPADPQLLANLRRHD